MSTPAPHGEGNQKHSHTSELQDKLQRLRAEEKKLHLAQSRHEEGQIRAAIRILSKQISELSSSPRVSEKSIDTRNILLDVAPNLESITVFTTAPTNESTNEPTTISTTAPTTEPTTEPRCKSSIRAGTQIFRLENQRGVVPVFETAKYYKAANIRSVSSITIKAHPLLVDGPIYISEARDCTMSIAARQVRLVNCHGLNLETHSQTGVCLEKSTGIKVTPMRPEQSQGIPWSHDPQIVDFNREQRI